MRSRSVSTPFLSSFTAPPPVSGTPCSSPVCAKFGHSPSAHDAMLAVAMWAFNECAHCKAVVAPKRPAERAASGSASTPSDGDTVPSSAPAVEASPSRDSPSFEAAVSHEDTDIPAVTLADDEVANVLTTDGYGILMDEQVMLGWGPVVDDGSTFCPVCRERFTALLHYRVWRGSGDVITSWCQYLSPSLLRAHMETVVTRHCADVTGSGTVTVDDLLTASPPLYWNMLWYSTRLALPELSLPLSLSCTCEGSHTTLRVLSQVGVRLCCLCRRCGHCASCDSGLDTAHCPVQHGQATACCACRRVNTPCHQTHTHRH